jgi:preprotein translocase subunit SecD
MKRISHQTGYQAANQPETGASMRSWYKGPIFLTILALLTYPALTAPTARGVLARSNSSAGIRLTLACDTRSGPPSETELQSIGKIMRARLAKLVLEHAGVEIDPGNRGRYFVTLPANANTARVKDLLTYGGRLELRPVAPGTEKPYPDWQSADAAARNIQNASEYEVVEFRESRSAGSAKTNPSSGWIVIERQSIIGNGDIVSSKAVDNPYYSQQDNAAHQHQVVRFELAPEAGERFKQWTASHIRNHLAIVLDGVVKLIPVINGSIYDQGMIEGDFDQWEAEDLAFALECGALPVGIRVLNEERLPASAVFSR